MIKARLLDELTTQIPDIKFTEADILAIKKMPDGRIVFLEKGQVDVAGVKDAGMAHIIKDHEADFKNIGIDAEALPKFLMSVINEGKIISYQGKGTGRPIYAIQLNGKTQYVAISVGKNGYVVGAQPAGSAK